MLLTELPLPQNSDSLLSPTVVLNNQNCHSNWPLQIYTDYEFTAFPGARNFFWRTVPLFTSKAVIHTGSIFQKALTAPPFL